MAKLSSKAIKVFKTCNLYCCFFVLGLCIAVPGPTLIDLTHLVNTNIKSIAFIYTARSVGYLCGSFAGGVVFDIIQKKQVALTICNFITSITMLGLPWSREIKTLTVWMVTNGLALGVLDTGGNVCCLQIWGKEAGPFYQALHFMYGLGGLVAPLVAAPFLGNFIELTQLNNGTLTYMSGDNESLMLNDQFLNNSSITTTTIPTVTYAYTSIGAFSFLVTILFLSMCIISPIDEDGEKGDVNHQSGGSLCLTLVLVLLASILILTSMGTEVGYAQMLTTYAKEGPLHLPTTTGSYMTSAYWAAFTLTRLAAIFLAIKFSNLMMLVFDVILTTIGSICLLLLAPHFEWALWVSSIILGTGIASFFPSCVSWLDTYITVTNKIASTFTIGASFGEMVIPFTISYFIVEFPDIFLYVNLGSCIIAIVVTLTMYLILRKLPNKYIVRKGNINAAFSAENNDNIQI